MPLRRLTTSRWPLYMEPEEKWYRAGDQEIGVRQLLVQDPDGYLVRLKSSLGRRSFTLAQGLEQGQA